MDTIIDLEDLDRVLQYHWNFRLEQCSGRYYAMATKYNRDADGSLKGTTIHLHRFVMGLAETDSPYIVDHKDADNTLDNRKQNLRITTKANNSSNRKGANKNSKTGVRNVMYFDREKKYLVSISKHGQRYHKWFESTQFDEACKWAEMRRKELFGDYAGKGVAESEKAIIRLEQTGV